MDNDKVRLEIEKIMFLNNPSGRCDETMVGRIMKVIEREVQLASDRSYYSALFESTGPIGCSMD